MSGTLSAVEQLSFNTVRIETDLIGGSVGTGTGFFYRAKETDDVHIPVVVTNRHVIQDSTKGRLRFTVAGPDNLPLVGNHITIELDDFQSHWLGHPLHDVDLCIMPVGPLMHQAEEQGNKLFFVSMAKHMLPTTEDLDSMQGMEDILMVGYPNGIWDEANNLPVLRKGITASNPRYDWNGKKEFLIDCACFPGSSGSPVIQMNLGPRLSSDGKMVLGSSRAKLLGILHAIYQHAVTGEIEIVDVPVAQKPTLVSRIPNNLGIILQSGLLRDFDDLLPEPEESTG